MTVIVAARTKDQGVVLAADSVTMAGWQKEFGASAKLWTADGYAFGGAGTKRVIQVVRHHVTWPRWRRDEEPDWEAFLVKSCVPAIREGVKDQGVVKNDSGIETIDAGFLIATGDQLAEISGDGCVLAPTVGRAAIGSGFAEALGYLGDQGPWTEAAVVDAARRALITCGGCAGPIYVTDTVSLTVRAAGEAT